MHSARAFIFKQTENECGVENWFFTKRNGYLRKEKIGIYVFSLLEILLHKDSRISTIKRSFTFSAKPYFHRLI